MTERKESGRLSAQAQSVVDAYFAAVRAQTEGADADLVEETLEGMREHVTEVLGTHSSAIDAAAAVERLGTPADIAETLGVRTAGGEVDQGQRGFRRLVGGASGSVLGVPYDVRVPTAERVASRWWDPRDPRLFVPRVFGLGWALNFGAVAVRLGIVRPDDEDEPFGEVPHGWFTGLLMLPFGGALWIALSYALSREDLPSKLPSHWGPSGAPDAWSAAPVAFGMLFALALVPTVWAASVVLRGVRPLAKGSALALASLMCAVAVGLWALTLMTADGTSAGWWAPGVVVLGAMGVTFAVLVALALRGRRAEMERDLARARRGWTP